MKERDFQTQWHHYLEANPPKTPEVYELKLCKTNRFDFSRVKKHQIDGLLKAKTGMFYKISDNLPVFGGNIHMRFTAKKPYDCLWIKSDAYLCVMFYIPRKRKVVVKIDIEDFIIWKDIFEKKSATFDEFVANGYTEVIKL